MNWRRDFSRPVKWTKDGRLIYDDYQEHDDILWNLRMTLKRLINHRGVEGFTNLQLALVCRALELRSKENEISNNRTTYHPIR